MGSTRGRSPNAEDHASNHALKSSRRQSAHGRCPAASATCRAQIPRIGPVTRSFFELARPVPPRWPRWGIRTVYRGRDTCFVNIVRRHRPLCLTSGSQEGSLSHHGNGPRVLDQPHGARGKPLVSATIRIDAPSRSILQVRHRLSHACQGSGEGATNPWWICRLQGPELGGPRKAAGDGTMARSATVS
jgi:hypothetical protein